MGKIKSSNEGANFFEKMMDDYNAANLEHREKLAVCVTSIAYYSDQLRAIAPDGEEMVQHAANPGYKSRTYAEYKEMKKNG